jgi:hypothetical protein
MSKERETRLDRLKRERPGLYASRHVIAGAGQVLLVVIGIGLAIRFIPWPDLDVGIDPPDLPDLPLPSISLPDPPGWVKAIFESKKYWWPIVIGLLLALGEIERQKRKKKEETES